MRLLHLPTVRADASPTADAAARDRLTHRGYLAELLIAETDARQNRRRDRRIKEVHSRGLNASTASTSPPPPPSRPVLFATIAADDWIDRGEPLVLLGDGRCA